MENLKHLSIKKTAMLFMVIALIVATCLVAITNLVVEMIRSDIYIAYAIDGEKFYLTTDTGDQLGNDVVLSSKGTTFSKVDNREMTTLNIISFASIPFFFIVCIVIAALLFFRLKLQKPLTILEYATKQIQKQNLDFELSYPIRDEMGQIITSFEDMRQALEKNHYELWRTSEERKRLNAAFAHELRTPLTVLKGHIEFVAEHAEDTRFTKEKLQSNSKIMHQQIKRLENYVDSMYGIQKLENLQIIENKVFKNDFEQAIREITRLLDVKQMVHLEMRVTEEELNVDFPAIMQVYENLLSNALRYAHSNITIHISTNTELLIQITDDGKGFTTTEIKHVTKPFYRTEKDQSMQHLGIGLYISKLICEKHSGRLIIQNLENGAGIQASFKL
ncbi:two-component sensor histidine kinase [Siminovitchia terrae]|uniref:histidine kinase n=1 Tax=Siminovitchia terrae TaxID=1914933 RepID=A0ABQ4KQG2_SIMTE|nr:HAMP domain-containing sensor histidine kinase [Siminovitchia terrae]GIN94279.1 two-component sensor histidine kinase [Siminovitchia terrae]